MGIKISNLPSGAAPTGVEIAPFVQSANTVSLSIENILAAGGLIPINDYIILDSSGSLLQLQSIDPNPWTFSSLLFVNNSFSSPAIALAKSRGITVGDYAIVQNGDALGGIWFYGSDGTSFVEASFIQANVDAVPGLNSMPTRLTIGTTPTGSYNPVERLRIDSLGSVILGGVTKPTYPGSDPIPLVIGYNNDNENSISYFSLYDTGSGGNNLNIYQVFENHNDDGYGDGIGFHYARGTRSTPAIVHPGDVFGGMNFNGWDGVTFQRGANIAAWVDPAFTPAAGSMPGILVLSTTPNGTTQPITRMVLDSAGNVIINEAVIATNATDGFLYVPTCAGVPNGTPTTYAGRSPIVVDSTDNRLYFYSTGAWRNAGP